MKRSKTITANDGDTTVKIMIAVDASGLTKNEQVAQMEGLTSAIMEAIPRTPYLDIRLSQIKVK